VLEREEKRRTMYEREASQDYAEERGQRGAVLQKRPLIFYYDIYPGLAKCT
jgi:hypothetical protein